MTTRHIVTFCIFILMCVDLKAQHITVLQQGRSTSIRGLSVVDDKTAWISGSKGNIAITKDGGKTWDWKQVKGFEKADFRDIEAFSDKEAIIISSGTPALILKTVDGGANWQLKYRNIDTACFLDAMDFADAKHGLVLGDPINGKFVLLETRNGGNTWNNFADAPQAMPGEAAFAASGTCLRVQKNTIHIVTGGGMSRALTYSFDKKLWADTQIPITHGKASQGTFSLAVGGNEEIFIGGDYSNAIKPDSVAAAQSPTEGIRSIQYGPAGYQSCVENITGPTYLSTGTSGTNITTNGGKTWTKLDNTSYNVCRRAKRGSMVLLAGDGGKIAILNP